nr:MAG TPA: hypothetical protein [Caudoviricetes sp.]
MVLREKKKNFLTAQHFVLNGKSLLKALFSRAFFVII